MTQNINLELRLLLTLEEKGLSVFTIDDAKDILKTPDSSIWHVLNGLVHKKRIRRIERSRYLLIPAKAGVEGYWSEYPWVIVPHLIDLYYVGFWTAMNYWDMTEQIPYTVFVATRKRKRNLKFGYQKFEFVTLSKKKFFGFVKEKANNKEFFNISSKEKTIVDGLMHPEYCGGIVEVTKAMWNVRNEVNWQTVLEMSEKVEINVVLKRLGYLLSLHKIEKNISEKIKEKIKKKPYHYLDPTTNKEKIEISKDFGLIINRTKNELLGWMDY
ncbi:MAG: type IV toxin-antitoxin system AbiEi family antitoxin domain-containing protein [Nitrosarchaeum sp.]